jgi:hypothetical protein
VVIYTLCISVFNLALGYAIAVRMHGRGSSTGWLRPALVSRLMVLRFGRDRLEPPADSPLATAAAPATDANCQSIAMAERNDASTTTVASMESAAI